MHNEVLNRRAELAARLSTMTGSQLYNEMNIKATQKITSVLAEGNVRLQYAQHSTAKVKA